MALIPPFFFDCVTAIGFPDSTGNVTYAATGFLFGKLHSKAQPPQPAQYVVYLVTNRHVFQGNTEATLRFNPTAASPAQTFALNLVDPNGTPLFTEHPDSEIDIVVVRINYNLLLQAKIQCAFFQEDSHILLLQQAQQNGVSEGDGVYVLGFPMGDVGKDRNYVVSRQGCLARIRDVLSGTTKHMLIDATIFPGNSGGPVTTKPESMAITGTISQTSANLIGIVAGYLPYRDIAISTQTNRPRVIFEENSGLGIVFPVDRILEVVNLDYSKLTFAATQQSTAASGGVA